ncbi:protein translocase subunit SecF [archaeon]|nr:protein translocase subunit SecF [archaeon]
MSRRDRRIKRVSHKYTAEDDVKSSAVEESSTRVAQISGNYKNKFDEIYTTQYKKLLWIPIVLLIIAFIVIGINISNTGEFINKAVSLKGGITLTVPIEESVDIFALESFLNDRFSEGDFAVRGLSDFGTPIAVMIEASSNIPEDELLSATKEYVGEFEDYSMESMGSSLGASFFKQTMIAVLLAFIFMGLVVFFYFRTLVPSGAVILAAFSDIIITVAVVDLIGMKVSTAGIAAFLMLIGYSVDTDILLSTRVLKRKEGSIMHRVYSAMRTGLAMNITTIVAVSAALIITDSETIRQIMTIILIGLCVDIINTWIQNVSILRLYLEKKSSK